MGEDSADRIQRKLDDKEFKLNLLLDITKQINNNVDKKDLYDFLEYTLRYQLHIGKALLFVNDSKQWECAIKYGTKGAEKKFKPTEDLEVYKEITLMESSIKEHLKVFEVIIPVYHKDFPLAFLLLGNIGEVSLKSNAVMKHLNFVQTLTNFITVAVENKRLASETVRQERTKKELELASDMQNMLFPDKLPDNKFLQIHAKYKPHQEVGGDYYDYLKLNSDEIVFCVADVSGKGVSAALLMANFQANLRALVVYKNSLIEIIQDLNEKVNKSAKGEKFITLFIGKYNLRSRTLNYVNAGHNPPLLYENDQFKTLNIGCTGLGMFEEIPSLKQGILTIPSDALLFCYTDGVVELENNSANDYGVESLKRFLLDHAEGSSEEINEKLIVDLDRHREDQNYSDDIALFTCRFF